MKLSGPQASAYVTRPDPGKAGLLIHGADAMRVALKRQDAVRALIGPEGEAEMRLTRLSGGDLRRDGAALNDAMRAVAFFPGPRAVFVEDATDGLGTLMAEALSGWRPGDAHIVATAKALGKASALRKAFEASGAAVSIAVYDEPPGREEIAAELRRAGLDAVPTDALADLTALARALDPGDFRQVLEKVALYKWRDATPLTPEDIAACAPATLEAAVEDAVLAVADGRTADVGTLMRRLEGQAVLPVSICIALLWHFKALHGAAADPGGAARGRQLYGARGEAAKRQAQTWGAARLEDALRHLVETDLTLRSSSRAPGMAVMERAMIRLALMPR